MRRLLETYAPALSAPKLKPRDMIVIIDLILRALTERKNNENLRVPQLENELADTATRTAQFRISTTIDQYKRECEMMQRKAADKKDIIEWRTEDNEKLRIEVEELKRTLEMYETTDRIERIRVQLYSKEPHFDRCYIKRDYLILLAENAPIQQTVDQLNQKLLETEEKCMADIVNESQWVDIFPPGFEKSLVKLLPRINIWKIRRQYFDELAGKLAVILKRIHIKRYQVWKDLQTFINGINPVITALMITHLRIRMYKAKDEMDLRAKEMSYYEKSLESLQEREDVMKKRVQDVAQATEDLLSELAEFHTPEAPTPVIPVSQPAMSSGVFNLSPEFIEEAQTERSRKLRSQDASLGLPDAAQVTRFEDRLGLSGSIGASRSIHLPEIVASAEAGAARRSPSPNWLNDSLELLHQTQAPAEMEDSLLESIDLSPDSLYLTDRVASPVSVAEQTLRFHEDPSDVLDLARPPTRVEDSLDLSGDIGFSPDSLNILGDIGLSPDSLDAPEIDISKRSMVNRWLEEEYDDVFDPIPQQPEAMGPSLAPNAPTEVYSVKSPPGSVKSLIKFSNPRRPEPFKMELEMKPQGIRQSPSGHRVICGVALEMKEAEVPLPRWRNIHFKKSIVRGSPPISETVGRRFDRKHGLFTPRSVIRRNFIGVRRPLFGDFPYVTGETPPRIPSPILPPLSTTIEWEGGIPRE
ncbi:uncharacterized protein TNIN_214641 [Trichonephila inaurata madagascariensis]|uniref:Uncharacterized protein n=1 Tax=Trichonephila inaurata madagascariensis TaxID=2747483 RepID=A0A8X6WVT0_9ARAC|nr:uncharacterized protein TNIN_214641 [Trichonephila inaurata madagascariensis]